MDALNLATTYILIALIVTLIWAPLLIHLLYRMNIVVKHILIGKVNNEFIKIHGHKSGTPTMGGLMISITVAILAVVLLPNTGLRMVFLLGWILFTLYGLADGLLAIGRKISKKLSLFDESFLWRMLKLAVLLLIGAVSTVTIFNTLGITELTLIGSVVLPINAITIPLFTLGMIFALLGMEITDGADGLVTGKFLIVLTAYAVISALSGHLELLPFLGLTIGSSLIYLYFNINPARVFMGGTGTLPIGFLLVLCAFVTNSVLPFAIMGLIFWVEIFSSTTQILSIKFLKRKLYRIAPIHHYFEAIGWSETKVVERFWWAGAILAVVALWVFSVYR